MIKVLPVTTGRERELFLTFPWKIYKHDRLWVPPLLADKAKTIDPQRGGFFKNGYAELFMAWKDGKTAGTIAVAEDTAASRFRGHGECMIGFFECIEDYAVAEALLKQAEEWGRAHSLRALYGPYNLDIEDSRGLLIEGRDRPPALLCGHTPAYYADFFDRFGLRKWTEDGLAYYINLDPRSQELQRLRKLGERVRARKANVTVRGADFARLEREIDIILDLSNRSLAHLPGFLPFTRESVEAVICPLVSIADPELVLFAEEGGRPAGFFPGVPNMNEVLIHLNGLRHPWDYLRLARYMRYRPRAISVKAVLVPPEYWDTGVGVLLFDEMGRRAAARGYTWADLSITGEDNSDTYPLAKHMGAQIYKRYRIYRKEIPPTEDLTIQSAEGMEIGGPREPVLS